MTFKPLATVTSTALGLCLSLIALPSQAYTPSGNQTLGSGPDIYRVELRDLGPLRVLSTGEKNNDTGELHRINVSLESAGQIDAFTDSSRTLMNTDGRRGGSGYLQIDLNNQVDFRPNSLPQGASRNLWIHARKNGDSFPTVVTLKIKGTELDCRGQTICDSGNTGTLTLTFDLPTFDRPPPRTCEASNSFPIRHSLPQGGMIDGLTNHSNYQGGSYGRSLIASGVAPTVNLQPTSGTICIASTSRPATYIKNFSTSSCVSLPSGNVPGVAAATAPTCQINRGRPEDKKAQWRITRKTGDHWSVKNTVSNHCLNVKSSQSGPNGGPVMAVGCSTHNDQSWRKTGRRNGQYILQNVSTGRCLTTENSRLVERACAETPNQLWKSIPEY